MKLQKKSGNTERLLIDYHGPLAMSSLDLLPFASNWQHWSSESALPERFIVSGVYVLLNLAGAPVYVGQSSDILRRLEEHRLGTEALARGYETKPKDFHRALYQPIADLSDRLRLEGILILALTPHLNRALFLRLSRDEETGLPKVSQFDPKARKGPRQASRRGLAKGKRGRRA